MEIWRIIKDFPNYEVSNLGIVRSVERVEAVGNSSRKRRATVLNNFITNKGYCQVQLYADGKAFLRRVNRLVAEAFVDNTDNKPEVNHKDGDKKNNRSDNLEWVTSKENSQHAISTGVYNPHMQATNRKVAQIDANGKIIRTFPSIQGASRAVGTSASNIRSACLGERKVCKGSRWMFV